MTGPGTSAGTISVATGGGAANTVVHAPSLIVEGVSTEANDNQQLSMDLYLQSGSKLAQVQVLLTATTPDPFVSCAVVGSAAVLAS